MLSIPIVSSFDNKGIKKAIQEFKELEGAGAKAQFALKKAAIPAAAALAGLGAALFDATKGALDDAAAQGVLARQLQRSTKATDAQIAANEEWISTQGKLLGVSDDELRPALAGLARATGSIAKAQKGASLAMDIAAAKNIDVAQASKVLERAYGGNLTAIGRLVPEMRGMIKDGASLEEVMAELNKKFGGEAAAAAQTTEGKMRRLNVALKETKESIGDALLPALEKALPYLQKFGDWAQKNPKLILAVAAAMTVFAGTIMAVNLAMSLNPVSMIVLGIIALGAAVVYAYKKFDGFREVVDNVFGGIKWWITEVSIPLFETLMDTVKTIFNGIASLWNNSIGKIEIKIPDIKGLPGRGKTFGVPDIPMLADGGIVKASAGGTLALIGEGGQDEAVIPLNRMGSMGGGVNITIQTGVGDPVAIGREVKRVMDAYSRRAS
jgi:ElaB/YqjD/DUF883 family membrane-anchored ribosome-binding protein